MERIYLTRGERRVLRWLRENRGALPSLAPASFCRAVRALEREHLVRAWWADDDDDGFIEGELTGEGRDYLEDNPRLLNPVNWSAVAAWIAAVASLGTLLVALLACALIGVF